MDSEKLKNRAEFFARALLLGAALRLIAYSLPGSTDMPIFDAWARHASVCTVLRAIT